MNLLKFKLKKLIFQQKFRINGPTSNLEEFSNAFKCIYQIFCFFLNKYNLSLIQKKAKKVKEIIRSRNVLSGE